jgi:hypothetical protein
LRAEAVAAVVLDAAGVCRAIVVEVAVAVGVGASGAHSGHVSTST